MVLNHDNASSEGQKDMLENWKDIWGQVIHQFIKFFFLAKKIIMLNSCPILNL